MYVLSLGNVYSFRSGKICFQQHVEFLAETLVLSITVPGSVWVQQNPCTELHCHMPPSSVVLYFRTSLHRSYR